MYHILSINNYKKTKLGLIPLDWNINKLSNYTDHITKGATPTSYGFNFKDKGINFIKIESISDNGRLIKEKIQYIDETTHLFMKRSSLRKNDIIFSIAGALGRVAIIDDNFLPANINQAIAIIRLNRYDLNIKYLYYYLRSNLIIKYIYKINVQAAQANLSLDDIRNIAVVIPPRIEQNKIAEILSTWDRAIEKTEDLIESKKMLKKGLMQQLLTGKLRFKEFVKKEGFKDTKIGRIPKDWEISSLNDLGPFLRGNGISKNELCDRGLPCITYGEIYTTNKIYIHEFKSHINEETALLSQEIQKGDILFAGSGETLEEIGKCLIYLGNKKVYAGGDILIFRNKKAYSLFLAYILNSKIFYTQSRKIGQGYSIVHIYTSGLKKVIVPFPSVLEQSKISSILYNLDVELEIFLKQKNNLVEIKNGLMQQLLTGKIRVKFEKT